MVPKTAALASGPLRYLEAGSGRPILLLHAFPLAADQWQPQLLSPPPGWRLVAPDLRGFGGSPTLGRPADASMDRYAVDVFELMTHLDIGEAAVAGLSMGGYVALAMLAADAGRITGLVLADTRATADTEEARGGRDRMIALVNRDGSSGVAEQMLPKLLGETSARQQPNLALIVQRMIEGNGPAGIEAALHAMRDRPDRSLLLPTITCPTVVICGTDDRVTPPGECKALSQSIPGAVFLAIDGAAHLSNLEQPEAFSAGMKLAM